MVYLKYLFIASNQCQDWKKKSDGEIEGDQKAKSNLVARMCHCIAEVCILEEVQENISNEEILLGEFIDQKVNKKMLEREKKTLHYIHQKTC